MGPLVAAGLISAGASVLSSVGSHVNSGLGRKYQAEQNQLDRDFNSAEAQKSRDFALNMFNRENEYNDPQAVVTRLQRAGINPALAYSGFAPSASGSVPSSASHNGSYSSPIPDYSGIESAGRSFLESKRAEAEIDLLNSEAEKNRKDVSWADKINAAEVELKKSGIDLNFSLKGVSDAQKKEIEQTTENLKQELSNLQTIGDISKERFKQAVSETHIKKVESEYSESEHISNILKTFSDAKLNNTQAWRVSAAFAHEMAAVDASARLSNSEADVHDFKTSVNKAMSAIKGIGGIADDQIQIIENTINELYERSLHYGESRKVSESNTETLAFASVISSLIGAGTQVMKMTAGAGGAHVGFKLD